MIRAFLDANAIASGLLGFDKATSVPSQLLHRWLSREFEFVTSDHVIAEVMRTLESHFFSSRIPVDRRAQLQTQLQDVASLTDARFAVNNVATHPEDDLVLAAAVTEAVDVLVTGDNQLLRLATFHGVRIVSSCDFLDLLPDD